MAEKGAQRSGTGSWGLGALVVIAVLAVGAAALLAVLLSVEIGTAVLAGEATVFGSVLTVVLNSRGEARRERERLVRSSRAPAYEQLVEFMFQGFAQSRQDGKVNPEKLRSGLEKLTPQLVTWASSDVVREWNRFRQAAAIPGVSSRNVVLGFERLVRRIRADLGHDDSGLAEGDVLRLFVTDVDAILGSGGA